MRCLFLCLALTFTGCVGSECDASRNLEHVERIGAIEVHESVRITSCFLEPTYEHVVSVRDTFLGDARVLDRYTNEAPGALTHITRVGSVLAISAGASLYLIDLSATASLEEAPMHSFMPAQALDISRWGDIQYENAPTLSIEASGWTLRYESNTGPLEFVSHDRGESFVLRVRSNPPAQGS
jgi:hypothetical protein